MSWTDRTLAAIADLVAEIGEAPPGEPRASRALVGLSRLIPYDCAVLCRFDGVALSPLAQTGYGRPLAPAVGHDEYRQEQRSLGMDASGLPLRFRDLPERGRTSFTVNELARPAGLHDGMGMSILSGRGHLRLRGHIALNAVRDGSFTDEHRDLLSLLARPLAVAVGAPAPAPRSNAFGLTARELEVLGLIAEGLTNLQIAETLVISPSTVRRHVEHVLMKLGAATRTAAAVKAGRYELL